MATISSKMPLCRRLIPVIAMQLVLFAIAVYINYLYIHSFTAAIPKHYALTVKHNMSNMMRLMESILVKICIPISWILLTSTWFAVLFGTVSICCKFNEFLPALYHTTKLNTFLCLILTAFYAFHALDIGLHRTKQSQTNPSTNTAYHEIATVDHHYFKLFVEVPIWIVICVLTGYCSVVVQRYIDALNFAETHVSDIPTAMSPTTTTTMGHTINVDEIDEDTLNVMFCGVFSSKIGLIMCNAVELLTVLYAFGVIAFIGDDATSFGLFPWPKLQNLMSVLFIISSVIALCFGIIGLCTRNKLFMQWFDWMSVFSILCMIGMVGNGIFMFVSVKQWKETQVSQQVAWILTVIVAPLLLFLIKLYCNMFVVRFRTSIELNQAIKKLYSQQTVH